LRRPRRTESFASRARGRRSTVPESAWWRTRYNVKSRLGKTHRVTRRSKLFEAVVDRGRIPMATSDARAVVDLDVTGPTISRHLYGHFAEHLGRCIYGGFWVGEDSPIPNEGGLRLDVVEALRALDVPTLRWPGGCFADAYHWRDGVGPKHERPVLVNTLWGDVEENNHVGTHECMALCEHLGADPYVHGKVGSGTVREMSEWVEYRTRDGDSPMVRLRKANGRDAPWKVPFWGIGNEA